MNHLNVSHVKSGTINLFKKVDYAAMSATCQKCMFEE